MKKLYFLNEEEKERILKLHENATSRQYISEIDTGSALGGAAAGAAIGSAFPVVGTVAGALIGGALGLIRGSGGSYNGVEKIFQACKNTKEIGKSTMAGATLDSIAKGVYDAVRVWSGTDEDAIKSSLSKIATIPDLCAVIKRYEENYPGYTLLGDLDGDIDTDSEWNEYVYQPLLAAKRKTEEISANIKATANGTSGTSGGWKWTSAVYAKMKAEILKLQPNWSKYDCIFNHPEAVPSKMSNGSWAIKIGNSYYYDAGRYKAPDGTMKSYTCPSSGGGNKAAVATTKTASTTKVAAKSSGPSPVTTSNIKQIQKIIGVAETGIFDDATKSGVKTKLGIK